jgi:hypothetical protein
VGHVLSRVPRCVWGGGGRGRVGGGGAGEHSIGIAMWGLCVSVQAACMNSSVCIVSAVQS